MTTLSLRISSWPAEIRTSWLRALVVLAVVMTAAVAAWAANRDVPGSTEQTRRLPLVVTPAKAAELVARTSASPEQIRAIGEQAKLLNAALPFSREPVEAARAFALTGGAIDHSRALLCLTQAVYYEAGFEPLAGRRAVAQVVLNRMRHPAFPKSLCGVVYQGAGRPVCQFSFVCDGSLNRAPAAAAWRQAREVAQAALAGFVESSVGSATHYHADYVAPYWAPTLTKIDKIGAHIFYRWPGAWGRRGAFTGRYAGEPRDPRELRPAPSALEGELNVQLADAGPATVAGPPLPRAPNDVGGLLDTSKGWTLNIPLPSEIEGKSAKAVAAQEGRGATAPPVVATAATIVATSPVASSRE